MIEEEENEGGDREDPDNFDLLNTIVDSAQDVVETVNGVNFEDDAITAIFEKSFLTDSNVRVDSVVNVVGIFWTVVDIGQ